ncbi:hypothetical protein NKR23_g5714 [Pleurostoma richardsiae]|uniref:Uncharacterized protein n=1 Tax=Pleurostoma richardsiae TaxID=41990 RepID=A0AA38RF66_9PEZI|nr:hypothetical protein NKR23_g5714 [Pleurostoma richardsiae]
MRATRTAGGDGEHYAGSTSSSRNKKTFVASLDIHLLIQLHSPVVTYVLSKAPTQNSLRRILLPGFSTYMRMAIIT